MLFLAGLLTHCSFYKFKILVLFYRLYDQPIMNLLAKIPVTFCNICISIKLQFSLQKKSKLETDNSVSNPSGNGIPDGLETEFSVFKTLVSNCVRLNSVSN